MTVCAEPTEEEQLYEPIRTWLEQYLQNNVKNCTQVWCFNGQNQNLSKLLIASGLSKHIPGAHHFEVQIDVFAVVQVKDRYELVITEVKLGKLNLLHLGQLLGYAHIIKPWKAILISPGGLSKNLQNFLRASDDNPSLSGLLHYGVKGREIILSRWDLEKNCLEIGTAIPRGCLDPVNFRVR